MEKYSVCEDYLKLVDVVTEKDDNKNYSEATRVAGLVREGMAYQKIVPSSRPYKRESEGRRRELSSIPTCMDRIRPVSPSTDRYLPPRYVHNSDLRTTGIDRIRPASLSRYVQDSDLRTTGIDRIRSASPSTDRYMQSSHVQDSDVPTIGSDRIRSASPSTDRYMQSSNVQDSHVRTTGTYKIRPSSPSTDRYMQSSHAQDSDVRTEMHGRITSDFAVNKLCDLMEKQVLSTKPKRRCESPVTSPYVQQMDELVKTGYGNLNCPNVPTSLRRMPIYVAKQPQSFGFLPFLVPLEQKLTRVKQVRSKSVSPWPTYTSVVTGTTAVVPRTTSVLTGNNSVLTGSASMVTGNSLPPIRDTNADMVTTSENDRFSYTCCQFCKKNGETSHFYKSHVLKDSAGNVRCPVLRSFRCPICNSTGDKAHTITYCPFGSGQASMMTATRTPRKSCGCPREKNTKRKCHHHDQIFS